MRKILGTLCLGLTVSLLVVGQLPSADRAVEKTARPDSRQPADSEWNQPLDSNTRILQLLNRITFGPRPGDVERVRQIGISAFLEQQLRPESVNESAAEAKVASLPTLSMSSRVLAENFQEMKRRAQQADPSGVPARSSRSG
jgi:hypothetical protein